MKKQTGIMVLAAELLLGAAYSADMLLWMDPATGLRTAGSIWLRYALAAAAAAVAFAGSRKAEPKAEYLRGIAPAAGAAALLAVAALALTASLWYPALQMPWLIPNHMLQLGGTKAVTIQLVLLGMSIVWMIVLGINWLMDAGKCPGGAVGGIAGTLYFYWLILMRFMANDASYYYVQPLLELISALCALLLLTSLARALLFPEQAQTRALCRSGLLAFGFCFCWELPETLYLWLTGNAELLQLAQSASLGCVGLLGAVCAYSVIAGWKKNERGRHTKD